MYLYRIVKGQDIRSVGKTQLQERAIKVRQKGYKARVVKTSSGYELFVEAGAVRAAGISLAGREKRKF